MIARRYSARSVFGSVSWLVCWLIGWLVGWSDHIIYRVLRVRMPNRVRMHNRAFHFVFLRSGIIHAINFLRSCMLIIWDPFPANCLVRVDDV